MDIPSGDWKTVCARDKINKKLIERNSVSWELQRGWQRVVGKVRWRRWDCSLVWSLEKGEVIPFPVLEAALIRMGSEPIPNDLICCVTTFQNQKKARWLFCKTTPWYYRPRKVKRLAWGHTVHQWKRVISVAPSLRFPYITDNIII